MKAVTVFSAFLVVILGVHFSYAAEPCVRATFRGDASTYNPNLPGWRTGGQQLATGGRYDPNSYDAALQLGLAKRYRCGYGRNAICHAIVQAPNERAMTVRINDNGPLVPGRVIDLNEKSMQYISNGTMGRNSGVMKNVTVTLLCGMEGGHLGPLNEADRAAWLNRTFNAPFVTTTETIPRVSAPSLPSYFSSPSSQSAPSPFSVQPPSPSPQPYQQPQQPAAQSPATPALGSQYKTQYESASSPLAPSPTAQPAPSALQTPTIRGIGSEQYPTVSHAALLFVQPREVKRGGSALVSWSSVGMSVHPRCLVTTVSSGTRVALGEDNEGSRSVKISTRSKTGTFTFTLRCVALSGDFVERTATLTVR